MPGGFGYKFFGGMNFFKSDTKIEIEAHGGWPGAFASK